MKSSLKSAWPSQPRDFQDSPNTDSAEWTTAVWLFIITCLEILLGVSALLFSFLRETHEFWLNSGGYPVFLRDLVLITYFPLMIFNFFVLFTLTGIRCAKIAVHPRLITLEISLILIGWVLFVGSIGVSVKNNIENYLEDRPIHAKPAAFFKSRNLTLRSSPEALPKTASG